MEKKIDSILERVHNIEKIMERNTATLEVHIKRTDLAEQNLELIRKDVRIIEKHVITVHGVAKFLLFFGSLIGTVYTIVRLVNN